MPIKTYRKIKLILVAPDGTRRIITGRFETKCAHDLVIDAYGDFLPHGARPHRLLRGGAAVAAYNPFRPLGVYGLLDGDVLTTEIDEGQLLAEPCMLLAYRSMQAALEHFEAVATAGAALCGHMPAVIK
jgi:hypothetical protein